MKFGIFYEHQLPRPWNEGDEQKLFNDALEQVEVADRLGIDYAWEGNIIFWKNIRIRLPPKYSWQHVPSEPRTFVWAREFAK